MPNLCIDCIWFKRKHLGSKEAGYDDDYCSHPSQLSLVDGKPFRDPEEVRYEGGCGLEGTYFERKV